MDVYIINYSTYMVGKFFRVNGKLKFEELWKNKYEHVTYIKDDYTMDWNKTLEVAFYPHSFNKFTSNYLYNIQVHRINYNNINKMIGLYDVVGNGVVNNTQLMKKALEAQGFEVVFVLNDNLSNLLKSLTYFKETYAEEKLLYYSVHGFNNRCEEYINLTNGQSLKVPSPDEIECDKIIYLLDKCSSPGESQTNQVCNIIKSNNLKLVCSNLIEDSTFNKKVIYLKAAETCNVSYGSPTGYATSTRCLLKDNQSYLRMLLDLESKEAAESVLLDMNDTYRIMQVREGIPLVKVTSLELLDTLPSNNTSVCYVNSEDFLPNYTFKRDYQYLN